MPVLDLINRQTVRISMTSLVLRRNLLEDITLSGGLVKPGDLLLIRWQMFI